jgi:hypothetical protein
VQGLLVLLATCCWHEAHSTLHSGLLHYIAFCTLLLLTESLAWHWSGAMLWDAELRRSTAVRVMPTRAPAMPEHGCHHAPCRYLGVSVLQGKPAIVMQLYAQGSLAAAIEAQQGQGLELKQALR